MATTTTTITTTTTTTTTIATGEPRDETAEGEGEDQDRDQDQDQGEGEGEREGEDRGEEDRDLPDPGACVGPKMEDAGGKPAAAAAAAAAAGGPGPGPEAGPEAADGSEEPPGPPGDHPPTVRPVKEEEPRREEGGRSPDLDGDSDHKHGGGGEGGGGEGRGEGDGDGGGEGRGDGGGEGRGDGGGGGGGGGELSDKRRTSVEVSSSDGEPLSRMDSEDSISSTLMEMESTVSSGRSTPAMMNGQGSAGGGGGGGPAVAKTAYPCCWDLCLDCFNSSPDLAEHIRGLHVDGQRGGVFVCLWKGCKVYNTPSTSQSWLHRHMLTHSGDKPFKCVVGGCTASFASQGGLARHVPSHFSQQSAAKLASQARLKEESPSKAGLNKRKKLKNKRRRSLPRPHDFFDAQTMDAIRHRAICLNLATHIESVGNGHSVVFHSTVLARRKEGSGKVKVLLHWTPEDILPDVWVNETERSQLKTKVVHLSQLPADTAMLLDPNIYRALPQKRLKQSL